MRGKYISIGIGSSKNKDPYKAGIESAKECIKQIGAKPNFSIVYTNSKFDQDKIAAGINATLGTSWVGLSADKQFTSNHAYDKNTVVSIFAISSKYLHFGVSIANNYRKDPKKAAFKATLEAMKKVQGDKYIDAYVQFTRTKKQQYVNIVKTPPYFILTFVSGAQFINKKPVAGGEIEFVNGILEAAGPHIPVFGGGAGSDFEDYLYKGTGKNYQFAYGKAYTNSGVVVFAISNLYFENNVKHGYVTTDQFAAITELDKTGYEILNINGKEAIKEYCRLIKIQKEKYLKDPFKYSLMRPFGLIALDGSAYIKEALPNDDGKSFHSTLKLHKNAIMNILKYDTKKHLMTMNELLDESRKGKIIAALFCTCSTRRLLTKGEEKRVTESLKKKYKIPFIGMYNFSEIGSTKTNSAQVHGETVTSLVLYDELLA